MLAIIGGTGLTDLGFSHSKEHRITTAYSEQPVVIQEYNINSKAVYFLSRHSTASTVPAHLINYRANIDALSQLGCQSILAFNAVGSIYEEHPVGSWVLPSQLIDYTWGREHSFTTSDNSFHIEFSEPFDRVMLDQLRSILEQVTTSYSIERSLVYGCTQGPRLETIAEVRRLKNDGCDVIGMTMMPEAALAKERNISYSSLCYVLNLAAGIADEPISEQCAREQAKAMHNEAENIIQSLVNISL